MSKLFNFKANEEEEDAGKAVEAKFKTIEDAQKETKDTLTGLADTIKAMNDRSAREEQARIDAKKVEDAKTQSQKVAPTAEEEFERFANDPGAFIREATLPATKLALMNTARQVKAEVLADKEYYAGDIKIAVDSMIEAEQNLALRANPGFVLNCYKIVVADNMDKIHKGEIKTRAALHSFSDGQGGGRKSGDDGKVSVDWGSDPKMKYAASQLGLSEDDLVAAGKDRTIRGLEVVA